MSLLWRDNGRPIRFFGVDGRAAISILLVLAHISLVTIVLAALILVVFTGLERFDYTIPNALRKLRSLLAGKRRYATPKFRRRMYRNN